MQMEEMILVSVDDHVVEPPDMFKNHLTAEYLAKAPKVSRLPSGCDVWEFNGQKLPNIGLNAVVGRGAGRVRRGAHFIRPIAQKAVTTWMLEWQT